MSRQKLVLAAAGVSAVAVVVSTLIVIGPIGMATAEVETTFGRAAPVLSLRAPAISSQDAGQGAQTKSMTHADGDGTLSNNDVATSNKDVAEAGSNGQGSKGAILPAVDQSKVAGEPVRVVGTAAILRSQPDAAAPMLLAYPVGRELRIVAHQGDYAKVIDPATAQGGWVEAKQVGSGELGRRQTASLDQRPTREAFDAPYGEDADPSDLRDWPARVERVAPRHSLRHRQGGVAALVRRAFGGF